MCGLRVVENQTGRSLSIRKNNSFGDRQLGRPILAEFDGP